MLARNVALWEPAVGTSVCWVVDGVLPQDTGVASPHSVMVCSVVRTNSVMPADLQAMVKISNPFPSLCRLRTVVVVHMCFIASLPAVATGINSGKAQSRLSDGAPAAFGQLILFHEVV